MPQEIDQLFPEFTKHLASVNGQQIAYRIGGKGRPLLLLHGFPQNHVMWHPIASQLARHYTVICADLRGYGDSSKPKGDDNHLAYSKREMAKDMIALMDHLGFQKFQLIGHDRGARVAHRLCLDHPDHVSRVALLDIIPTKTFFDTVNKETAEAYYHWFFLTREFPFPEEMIGNSPQIFLNRTLGGLGSGMDSFHKAAVADYERCFTKETIHAICEDYRAAATIDLIHDKEDLGQKIQCPTLILWGCKGIMHKYYDLVQAWREKAALVTGQSLKAGHFLVEECPEKTLDALCGFLE